MELLGGLIDVAFDVFFQVLMRSLFTISLQQDASIVTSSILWHNLTNFMLLHVCVMLDLYITVVLAAQKLHLRNLPALKDIGGPADGCTCIVTGPTRCAVLPGHPYLSSTACWHDANGTFSDA